MVLRSSKRKREFQPEPAKKKSKRLQRRHPVRLVNSKPLKFTDVIDDCLEHVFGYLDATDLNNIADAHHRFVPVARSVYKQKYGNGDEKLMILASGRLLLIKHKKNDSKEIVNATPTSFLANFGHLVRKLELDYSSASGYENAHHWRAIEKVIFEHCSGTLTSIQLDNCSGNVMEGIQKPFEVVNRLCIVHGFTEPTKVNFCNWFPNITYLNLSGKACNAALITGNFRVLKQLRFRELDVIDENIRKFIVSNPHMEDVLIEKYNGGPIEVSVGFLEFLSGTLTHLKNLYLNNVIFEQVDSVKHIHFPNVNQFMYVGKYPNNISIILDQLNTLILVPVEIDSKWKDFIVKNKSLASLKYTKPNFHLGDLIKFTTELPALNELSLRAPSISIDDLMQLLKTWYNWKTVILEYDGKVNLNEEISKFKNMMKRDFNEVFECVSEKRFKHRRTNTFLKFRRISG